MGALRLRGVSGPKLSEGVRLGSGTDNLGHQARRGDGVGGIATAPLLQACSLLLLLLGRGGESGRPLPPDEEGGSEEVERPGDGTRGVYRYRLGGVVLLCPPPSPL